MSFGPVFYATRVPGVLKELTFKLGTSDTCDGNENGWTVRKCESEGELGQLWCVMMGANWWRCYYPYLKKCVGNNKNEMRKKNTKIFTMSSGLFSSCGPCCLS